MEFVIGDRNFNTPDSKQKLGAIIGKNPIQRFALGQDIAIPFAAITVNPFYQFLLPLRGASRFAYLNYLHVDASFTDLSAGTIYTLTKFRVNIPAFNVFASDNQSGLSYSIDEFKYNPNLLLQPDSTGVVTFTIDAYGATIAQETGIAPAAGDTVSLKINIGYQLTDF